MAKIVECILYWANVSLLFDWEIYRTVATWTL